MCIRPATRANELDPGARRILDPRQALRPLDSGGQVDKRNISPLVRAVSADRIRNPARCHHPRGPARFQRADESVRARLLHSTGHKPEGMNPIIEVGAVNRGVCPRESRVSGACTPCCLPGGDGALLLPRKENGGRCGPLRVWCRRLRNSNAARNFVVEEAQCRRVNHAGVLRQPGHPWPPGDGERDQWTAELAGKATLGFKNSAAIYVDAITI